MIIFKTIEINGFRNIKHCKFEDLRDLNILIGPNNCGKTNFLEFISSLSTNLNYGKPSHYLCPECEKFSKDHADIDGMSFILSINDSTEDFYLKNPDQDMEIKFLLNKDYINQFASYILVEQQKKLKSNPCNSMGDEIIMKQSRLGNRWLLVPVHCSPFIYGSIIEKIKGSILYCPDKRLEIYKQKNFVEYIREKRLTTTQKREWINFLQKIIDPRINDERTENLIIKVNGKDFEDEISKQGSGVRSLVCLAIDILSSPEKEIILIDEPELGLNPLVKQEFLKFLLKQSETKQIFIATQDPTFVNPVLWDSNRVGVYFYSIIKEAFVKIDLKQNQEDPSTFAGYLPHTVSLKKIHIYVEGTSDVYIFQIFLQKYLKETFNRNWFEIINKVGVFHLGGDFWPHLLYTIPKPPYKSIIILDGDKREKAKEICEKYNSAMAIAPKFAFCETTNDIKGVNKEVYPVYCLKENCIERYIFPNFNCSNPFSNYNKKVDGPKKAEELIEIPNEIKQLFEIIFSGIQKR